MPPTTVTNAVSTGEAFSVTECTFTAAFAVLKIDSVLSSMIRAVAYPVGPAITVNSEPANEVTTPAPLGARVIAGPPTEVTILSATPLMAAEDMGEGLIGTGPRTCHSRKNMVDARVGCEPSRGCKMLSSVTIQRTSNIPSERPSEYQEAAVKWDYSKCQGMKIKITYQRRLLQYNKNLPRLSTSLWRY